MPERSRSPGRRSPCNNGNIPEALAKRVTLGILNNRLPSNANLTESVSQILIEKLLSLAKASKLDLASKLEYVRPEPRSPVFIRRDLLPQEILSGKIKSCFVLPDCSMLISSLSPTRRIDSINYQRLCSMLFELLKLVYPLKDFTKVKSIIIDDDLGYDIPTTIPELLSSCIRLEVPRIVYGKNIIEIDDELHSNLVRELWVKFTGVFEKIVSTGTENYVSFKRYYPPKIISQEESKVLALLNQRMPIEKMQKRCNMKFSNLIKLLRRLEQSRIIKLYLPDDLGYAKKLNDKELFYEEVFQVNPKFITYNHV